MIYNGNRQASSQSFAALWQINNWRNPFSRRSSLPRGQRENVVGPYIAECNDHGSNPVQGTIFVFIFNVCD